MSQQRPHRVHLRVAHGRISARVIDFFEDQRGGVEFESGSAILFGDQGGEKAGLRQGCNKTLGIGAFPVELAPVRIAEGGADVAHRVAQRALVEPMRSAQASGPSG